jgi:hypothetical protein
MIEQIGAARTIRPSAGPRDLSDFTELASASTLCIPCHRGSISGKRGETYFKAGCMSGRRRLFSGRAAYHLPAHRQSKTSPGSACGPLLAHEVKHDGWRAQLCRRPDGIVLSGTDRKDLLAA